MNRAVRFFIEDQSAVGEVRRFAASWAIEAGLDEIKREHISIVVSELTTNILKHAGRGEVICNETQHSIEIISIDRGPGILDPRSFEDGFSTHGTAGTGLGAIKRLADEWDYFSSPKGTVMYAGFRVQPPTLPIICSGFSIALKGEEVCGDAWTCDFETSFKLMVADGLGHGLLASEASRAAVEEFKDTTHSDPFNDITLLHGRLRSTRGAAVSVAYLNLDKKVVEYAGLGNIAGAIVSPGGTKKMISYNGTAGVQMRKIQTLPYPWTSSSAMILHSDGLGLHWDLSTYPGLLIRHPAVICGVLYRDYSRGNDDVTVVCVKESD